MDEVRISNFDLEILEHDPLDTLAPVSVSIFSLEILNSNPFDILNPVFISNFTIEIIHKYNPISGVGSYTYYFSGDVFENAMLVSRNLYAFGTNTGMLVGSATSGLDGTFLLPTTTSGSCYVVCLSNNIAYNHLIAARVAPTS